MFEVLDRASAERDTSGGELSGSGQNAAKLTRRRCSSINRLSASNRLSTRITPLTPTSQTVSRSRSGSTRAQRWKACLIIESAIDRLARSNDGALSASDAEF